MGRWSNFAIGPGGDAMSAAEKLRYSPAEYLALERKAESKSEYRDGVIYSMSGASREHNIISLNLGAEINRCLRDRTCEAYAGDMRVLVDATGLYTYPDLAVACDDPQFLDGEFDVLLNPTLIVEVLSPSTEGYDRGKKFGHYRRVDSLREYVLVSQDRVWVEQYTLQEGNWVLKESNRRDDLLRLTSIGCEVSLRDIYAKVQVPEGEPGLDAV
jgi:Uma2 family endonuclease